MRPSSKRSRRQARRSTPPRRMVWSRAYEHTRLHDTEFYGVGNMLAHRAEKRMRWKADDISTT